MEKEINTPIKIDSNSKILSNSSNLGISSKKRSFNETIPRKKSSFNDKLSEKFSTKIISNIDKDKKYKRKKCDDKEIEKIINDNTLTLDILYKEYKLYEEAICCKGPSGVIKSYAYNSYRGLVKDYNEDKVLIKINIKKPPGKNMRTWPKISIFAIFDGHGGENCSQFLEDNFTQYLLEDKNFPIDIKLALGSTLTKLENDFNKKNINKSDEEIDNSGSCACILVFVDNKIYIANVGDSRAILSIDNGLKLRSLTIDHKADNPKEFERIIKNGGKIFIDEGQDISDLTNSKVINQYYEFLKYESVEFDEDIVYRESPADLTVMRTIGDIKNKEKKYGGLPNTIISTPDFFSYEISSSHDFIVLGCDGIFDDLTNHQIIDAAWFAISKLIKKSEQDINKLTKNACDMVMKLALKKLNGDNLSCVIIALEGLEKYLSNKKIQEKICNSTKVIMKINDLK